MLASALGSKILSFLVVLLCSFLLQTMLISSVRGFSLAAAPLRRSSRPAALLARTTLGNAHSAAHSKRALSLASMRRLSLQSAPFLVRGGSSRLSLGAHPQRRLCASTSIAERLVAPPAVGDEHAEVSTNATASRPRVIFVLGGPGAGKGTQCERLSKQFGVKHLSAGELLRAEQARGSEHGKLIDAFLAEGRIVPVEISLSLLKREILSHPQRRFLIDGFPRNEDNLQGWLRVMRDVCEVELVVFIECLEEELERRILLRGQTSNRSDDNIVTLRKRFATFERDSMPVVEFFQREKERFPFAKIQGNQSIEKVYQDLSQAFVRLVEKDLLEVNREINEEIAKEMTSEKSHELAEKYFQCSFEGFGEALLNFEAQAIKEGGAIADSDTISVDEESATYSCSFRLNNGRAAKLVRKWKLEQGFWRIIESSVA